MNNTAPSVTAPLDQDDTTHVERCVFLGSFVEARTGQRVSTYRIADQEIEIVELPCAELTPPSTDWRDAAKERT